MRKIALIVLVALLTSLLSTVYAAPFLVCDPYPTNVVQPDYFIVILDGVTYNSQAFVNPNGSKQLKFDVGFVSSGSHNVTVKACKSDPLWGELCSDEVPFVFERPSAVVAPGGLKLSK